MGSEFKNGKPLLFHQSCNPLHRKSHEMTVQPVEVARWNSEEREAYRADVVGLLGLHMVTGKFSAVLVAQLLQALATRTLDIYNIVDEIGGLEGAPNCRPTNTKPPGKLSRGKLQGLWHKHFFQAAFMPRNILEQWSEEQIGRLMRNITNDPSVPEHKQLDALAYRLVMDGIQNRSRGKRMTGEWIIYARCNKRSYYLTLASHRENEEDVWQRVQSCTAEFPELAHVLMSGSRRSAPDYALAPKSNTIPSDHST